MGGSWDNVDYSLLGEDHVRRYQQSGGRDGYWWNGAPSLLLTHTGRRSGAQHTTPLIYGRDGDDHLVVASMGGWPTHPQWYRNLEVNPLAHIQVWAERFEVVAHTAGPEDKPRLWKIMQEVWPNYDKYQERTDRVIPVVVLRRRS